MMDSRYNFRRVLHVDNHIYLIANPHQTNYVGHWLLTHHLLPILRSTAQQSAPGSVRVVNVTSDGHARMPPNDGISFDDINLKSKNAMTRYCQSKLANILHTNELNRRYGPNGTEVDGAGEIWFASVHPGHIDT
jgi:NAD(P)-dependent dehydrogenase (short-subunit alcohol dehydrogenase family)